MSDLVEFLRARLDQDEAVARRLEPDPAWMRVGSELSVDNEDEITISVGRVLREVEAKRQIVDRCGWLLESFADREHGMWPDVNRRERHHASVTLDLLAAVYSDHPDYRQEWKP